MLTSHATLKFLRKAHLYIGVFIAPALIFFAFTGALQTFGLHETSQGSSYKPPAWLVALAQLHKKQTTVVPVRKLKTPPPERPAADAHKSDKSAAATNLAQGPKVEDAPAPALKSHLPMKIFFLLVSVGLFASTLTGVYMAYKYSRGKFVITSLLLAGIVVPVLLIFS
jgi:hypothetical protein